MKTDKVVWILIAGFFLASCGKKNPAQADTTTPPTVVSPALHVEGRWLVKENGDKVILRGVNIASLEWNAAGDNMMQSLNTAINTWGVNFVRIPLCQDRWFGKAPEQSDNGVAYQALVDQLVERCSAKKVYILLELHWNDAGIWGSHIGQHKMPDQNSVVFLKSLAAKYANIPVVLLGLYNEPHDISWSVWLNGGDVTETWDPTGTNETLEYRAVGMQAMYDSVRASGATQNLIVISGIDWAFDISTVASTLAVNGSNIVYDTHCYPWKNANWDLYYGNVGRSRAILVGEWGGNFSDGYETFDRNMAKYLRDNRFCWSAWDFHPSAGPTLIRDWTYTPTDFGQIVKTELLTPLAADTTGN